MEYKPFNEKIRLYNKFFRSIRKTQFYAFNVHFNTANDYNVVFALLTNPSGALI